ncbi:MAG: hypothetical protein PWQ79_288 [Thermococcaceae archaeon]|nr:hypothetical protein [Thermococcaceae archaeon]MDK2913373.1 hypothetical protein [Thermococcaceae archaeon]
MNYEAVKLGAEVVAFVFLTGAVYTAFSLRSLMSRLGGAKVSAFLFTGAAIFWLGYLTNVLNDVFPIEFMKVFDDVLVAIGMLIITLSAFVIKENIAVKLTPKRVGSGNPKLKVGSYMIKPLPLQELLGLLEGGRVFAVTRNPEPYRKRNIPHLWITAATVDKTENVIHPTRLPPLLHAILENSGPDTFLIIDGVDYLKLYNGFDAVMKFLLALKDNLSSRDAGIVLVLDPETMERREVAMLEKEFQWLTEGEKSP